MSDRLINAVPSLKVRRLEVEYATPIGKLGAVQAVDLDLLAGSTFTIIGESGSGKSTLARALLGLVPPSSLSSEATFQVADQPIQRFKDMTSALWKPIRGRQIGFVVQDPMQALNPLMTVEQQIYAVWYAKHKRRFAHTFVREQASMLLRELDFPDPARILQTYPFQLSGGQCQRVALAIALINEPQILIADEPTTALDVRIQQQVLALLQQLQVSRQLAILLITHDLTVALQIADQIGVMYAGHMVEVGSATNVLQTPQHPYTQALLRCMPRQGHALPVPLEGNMPSPLIGKSGCAFYERCERAIDRCSTEIPTLLGNSHSVACWNPAAQIEFSSTSNIPTALNTMLNSQPVILEVENLSFEHIQQQQGRNHKKISIFENLSFVLRKGEILGCVGESGCGKTTLARCLTRLLQPSQGTIRLLGHDISHLSGKSLRQFRSHIQYIFQDARGALNPRRSILELVCEPLRYAKRGSRIEQHQQAQQMLEQVGLPSMLHNHTPTQLSTGQCQRVAIARALVIKPQVLICDEPFSALDLSIQAQILQLFTELQAALGFGMLLISHNLQLMQVYTQRILVLHDGQICDDLPAHLLNQARHPHTHALLKAVPQMY